MLRYTLYQPPLTQLSLLLEGRLLQVLRHIRRRVLLLLQFSFGVAVQLILLRRLLGRVGRTLVILSSRGDLFLLQAGDLVLDLLDVLDPVSKQT